MSSILKRILKGHARPAVMRPVPMVPRSEAVKTLELRVQQSIRRSPVEREPDEPYLSPLMSVGRIRQAEDSKVAQLERELVMERLRTKELREKLVAVTAVLRDMEEQYESIGEDMVCVWVEETVFPDLKSAVEGGGL